MDINHVQIVYKTLNHSQSNYKEKKDNKDA